MWMSLIKYHADSAWIPLQLVKGMKLVWYRKLRVQLVWFSS